MALPAPLQAVLRPRAFFADAGYDPGTAVAVVLVVSLVTTVVFGAVGWVIASGIDATYTETVQEPWSEATCESFAEMNTSHTPGPCALDEPKTRQVDVGEELWRVWAGRLPVVFVGSLLGWLLTAAGLHVVSTVLGGEGSFTRTSVVAAWGMIPGLLQTVVGLGTLLVAVQGIDFGADPATLERQVRQLSDTVRGAPTILAALVVAAWQAYVWAGGLEGARDLDRPEALFAAATVSLVTVLFSVT